MSISNYVRTGLLAAAFILTTGGAAFAVSAVATGAVNVRTGPGTSYTKVDTLHAGENVDVRQCQTGWCYVEHNGPDGWVSAKYLSQSGNSYGGGYTPQQPRPNVNFSFGFGSDNSQFGFSFGTGHYRPYRQPRVCFYDGRNYSGASFCATEGTNYRRLGGWSNRISSVKVFNGATATLCQQNGYGGFCRRVTSNENALGPFLNNRVSSLRVN